MAIKSPGQSLGGLCMATGMALVEMLVGGHPTAKIGTKKGGLKFKHPITFLGLGYGDIKSDYGGRQGL